MSALPGTAPAPDTRWRPWPGHAAVSKPPCTGAPGCRGGASRWLRCACGLVFSACGDHGRDLGAERAKHATTCAAAQAAAARR